MTSSRACGADVQQLEMFSYVSLEERMPKVHPIRKLRTLVDTILSEMDDLLTAGYASFVSVFVGGAIRVDPPVLTDPSLDSLGATAQKQGC